MKRFFIKNSKISKSINKLNDQELINTYTDTIKSINWIHRNPNKLTGDIIDGGNMNRKYILPELLKEKDELISEFNKRNLKLPKKELDSYGITMLIILLMIVIPFIVGLVYMLIMAL